MRLVSSAEHSAMRARYGDRVITQHLVVPFKKKQDPNGNFTRATVRITYADTGDETKSADCFSACLYAETARYLSVWQRSCRARR